jgi:hypothetical protein
MCTHTADALIGHPLRFDSRRSVVRCWAKGDASGAAQADRDTGGGQFLDSVRRPVDHGVQPA